MFEFKNLGQWFWSIGLAVVVGIAFFGQCLCCGQVVSFRKQVQPILAGKCLACHGPDENAREAGLRLDTESGAKDSMVVPGKSDESELIERINSDDPDVVMPPPGHGKPLSPIEKKVLKDWIDQGAPWEGHWAFEPIRNPETPNQKFSWSQSPIDQFVLRRMRSEGLKPSPQADDRVLIRRVYFDLVGLPPTPQQVENFVNDPSEDRFEKVVDSLLESKRYGEKMAASWLDIARFADTNGFQNDFSRSMWVYRDWVIDAFNQNMPYDQFILEQIAGDMLPNPQTSQLIASGFNRNNPSVTEGGAIEEEWRVENCVDRVETTSAAFLGLTVGCARCHDHKYDPVSQQEFFELFAFFNNVDEKGVYTERRGNAPPMIKTPTKDQLALIASLEKQIEKLKSKPKIEPSEFLKRWQTETAIQIETPDPSWSLGRRPAGPQTRNKTDDEPVWSPAGMARLANGRADWLLPDSQPIQTFERDDSFSWVGWIHGGARGAIFGKTDESQSYRGVDTLILGDGRLKIHLISTWPSDAIAVLSKSPIPGDWNHIAVTYDGTSKATGFKIYLNGKPVPVTIEQNRLKGSTLTSVPFKIGQRNTSSFLQGKIGSFDLFDTALQEQQISFMMKRDVVSQLARCEESGLSTAADVAFAFMQRFDDGVAEIANLNAQKQKAVDSQQTTMVMKERSGDYRPTWKLNRGQYDQPIKETELWPGVPAVLPQLTGDQPQNRLGLARWLVDERNPLVARVIVNRVWQQFFGRGIVESVDNFGVQGDPPTHPDLLDWLAHDFRNSGWDLKRLQRQIVLSATYQQSSELSPEMLSVDRENRWLSRGARRRLSAEEIRDSALLMSGLLSEKIGGPSVFPYQPDGLWDELAGGANGGPYRQSKGPDLYRRSLYTYRKRTVPHPTTSTFDAPSWEKCQVDRSRTNTPLQALALLNDTSYVEAARKFAERILDEGGSNLEEQIDFATRVAMSRRPTAIEKSTLTQAYQYHFEFYRQNLGEAKRLISIGESKSKQSRATELASMTSVALVIMNLDQTITKE